MDSIGVVVVAVWVMLPAYVPNNAAVLAGGGRPIDGGRTYDGSRLLGDGKTWRGTVAGWAAGAVLAVVLNGVGGDVAELVGTELPEFPVAVVVLFPLGAMLGDIGASFLKRRTGRERGTPLPGVDQLDFVVGSLLLALVGAPGWVVETFTTGVLVVVFVLTPILHVLTNGIGYALGVKDEPY
jgi:CDP-2,3-bis-(O-geranylgeranyl)-sn-glycerol synthase